MPVSVLLENGVALVGRGHRLLLNEALSFIPLLVVYKLAGLVEQLNLIGPSLAEMLHQCSTDLLVHCDQNHVGELTNAGVVAREMVISILYNSLDRRVLLPDFVLPYDISQQLKPRSDEFRALGRGHDFTILIINVENTFNLNTGTHKWVKTALDKPLSGRRLQVRILISRLHHQIVNNLVRVHSKLILMRFRVDLGNGLEGVSDRSHVRIHSLDVHLCHLVQKTLVYNRKNGNKCFLELISIHFGWIELFQPFIKLLICCLPGVPVPVVEHQNQVTSENVDE